MFRLANSAAVDSVRLDEARLERSAPVEQVTAMYDRFRAPLLRYLSAFGLDYSNSEEVIQEVFLALFQHLRRGKSSENLPGWIFRVAHNLALRQQMRYRQENAREAERAIENVVADPAPNPEADFAIRQTHARVLAVVDALPELDRRCIFLRAEGLRYREIARIVDMSLGGVALSLSRSLARIARCAERYQP